MKGARILNLHLTLSMPKSAEAPEQKETPKT